MGLKKPTFFLVFAWALMLNYSTFAEESEEPSQEASGSEAEPAPTHAERVPALDEWVEIEPEETPPPTLTPEPTTTDEVGDESVTSLPVVKPPIPDAEIIGLNKWQKKRLELIEKRIRAEAWQRLKRKKEERTRDPRGAVELRVCSLNLNGYGDKDEVKRLIKARGANRLKRTELSALKILSASNCDVVAVQGIVGRSMTYASEALEAFLKKLRKRTKVEWEGSVAHSAEQTGFQAVLVRDPRGARILGYSVQTYNDELLRSPGKSLPVAKPVKPAKKEIVQRDFIRVNLEVGSEDFESDGEGSSAQKKTRKVILLNGIIARSVNPFDPEPPLVKMQVAEVGHRIFRQEQSKITPFYEPLLLLAIDRGESFAGVSHQILNGRLELDDFSPRGTCKADISVSDEVEGKKTTHEKSLVVDSHYSCDPRPARPELLFDVAPRNPLGGKVHSPTAGIYVDERDLLAVRNKGTRTYSSGAIPLANGLPGAYLVWVDLNW